MNTNTKPTAILIAFAGPAFDHWAGRFAEAFAGNVDRISVPTINEDGSVTLPAEREGVVLLVNARVAAAIAAGFRKYLVSDCGRFHSALMTRRNDIFCLPVGAPQDGSPVDISFLVKVE